MVSHFAGHMTRNRRQEEESRALTGMRILARMIARSLMGEQRNSGTRNLEPTSPRQMDGRGTRNGGRRDSQNTNAEEDSVGDEIGGKPHGNP